MKENKSIRIRTTVNQDKFIKVHLNQTFDFLEILSLKLRQEDVYRSMCSDYGMLCGRVSTKDFGIPNAKISIFIPLSEEDENNQLIKFLYPYKRTSDKDERGIRYNLLPKWKKHSFHQPVGTFPSKREILDNDLVLEVYEKYYKFSTITNSAGDYMIFGIPIGTHTVHMDIDFSDTGMVSSRPWELIEKGYNKDLFESSAKFRRSTNLDELAQIVSENKSVEILPFWGNLEQCEVGITRTDFDIQNFEITPTAIFFGNVYSDLRKNLLTYNDIEQPDAIKWESTHCHVENNSTLGKVFTKTKLEDGTIENLPDQIFGGNENGAGNWAFSILMNKSKKVTDEFGNLVISSDPSKGLPTEIDVRFTIRYDFRVYESETPRREAGYYLVPNTTNNFHWMVNPEQGEFYTMMWKRIYTVRQYIPRYQGSSQLTQIRKFLGIQRGNECPSSLNFPYNRISTNLTGINSNDRKRYSLPTEARRDIKDEIITSRSDQTYEKSYDFYNNWINGSLYMILYVSPPNTSTFSSFNNSIILDTIEFTESGSLNSFTFGTGQKVAKTLSDENIVYITHPGSDDTNSNVFLFATNITDLGSFIENPEEFGTPDAPFLFDKLSHSTYNKPGNVDVGFFNINSNINGTGVSGPVVKPGTEESIARTSEIGHTTTIDPSTLDITETFDDPTRKWLCENNNGGTYNNSTHRGNDMKILFNSTNNGKFSYYFYFGMLGGVSNSLGLVKQKFFS